MITKKHNGNWRIALTVMALLVVVLSIVYTNYLVTNVAKEEKRKVENYINAFESFNNNIKLLDSLETQQIKPNYEVDLNFQSEVITNIDIPLILVSQTGKIQSGNNFGNKSDDVTYLNKELKKIQLSGRQPLVIASNGVKQYVYYKESNLIQVLKFYPVVMFILVISFVMVGFLGFRSEKNAEQNRIWAGLAKETAHQLGTPISGIVAWMEHLKIMKEDDEETMGIVSEVEKDLTRLNYITERFSKIGSTPELSQKDITVITHYLFKYMEKRAPKRVQFKYPPIHEQTRLAAINVPLFEWVLENLLRNALDATGKEGLISGEFIEDNDYYYLDISDTGKGVPENKFNTIFKPGYSTKKRGWGLGLSLAKRIIESYHNGKIFVKESVVDQGTTFRIQLPKTKD